MSEYYCLINYLKKQHVLSLCVTDAFDFWCCNCFYVFNEALMVFWLMTELDTRHAKLMIKNPRVAGTINDQTKNIMLIQGVQYRGRIVLLSSEEKKHQVRTVYYERFLISNKNDYPVWEISLEQLKMTNNLMGFGKKILWSSKNI